MSGARTHLILHVGSFHFPMTWDEWYSGVEKITGSQFELQLQNDFKSDFGSLKNVEFIRLNRQFTTKAFSLFNANTPLISTLKYIDIIFRKNSQFWSSINHKEALRSVILENQPSLNVSGAGLIIGFSTEALIAAFVLVEFGIKQITFVIENESDGQKITALLEKTLFEIQFEVINKDKVILLPGIYSAVIIYDDLRDQDELVTALLYFNYLERGGLIVNAGCPLDEITLLEEAFANGAKIVDFMEVLVHEEILALQKIIPINHGVLKKLLTFALPFKK